MRLSVTLADDLEKRFPEHTSVKSSYLPALRALRPALNQKSEASKAIELLQIAAPYELGVPQSSFYGGFGAMYPVYVRGESYLAARQVAEAAAEFQKILGHRGIVLSDPVGALAHLQLGRGFVLSGDKAKANGRGLGRQSVPESVLGAQQGSLGVSDWRGFRRCVITYSYTGQCCSLSV